MRKHFASLFYATEDCLESVTVEFFSKSLISRDVRKSPSFYKIENEFVASLFFCEDDMAKLEEKCRNFVHCLAKAGGPAKDAAIALAEDWERDVLNKHNLKWSLKIDIKTLTDLSLSSEIPLSSEVPQKVQDLHKSFLLVMKHIRTYYNECRQYNVEDFARYLTDDYEVPLTGEPLTNCKSLDSLFHSVKSHYSFFKFDLIEDLVKEFPPSDELQLELDQYMQELEQFKKSTALRQMKEAIKQVPLPHEASEAHCKIVIKLTGSWRDKTVKSLENLIQYLFKRDAKRAKLIKIDEGSIVVTFLTFSTAQSLIDKIQNKSQFIQYLGIFVITINNDIVIDREEDANFTFEDSLLHVINDIDSDAEYERVALLLIELKIELNYQNTDGQTALMLASQGGNIKIFNSLLQSDANPFIQLPTNKRYVGLNYLACTALSQHIYKSIGGEKIIPQDDTSFGEMLEMAVKERGVSSYFYDSFVHVIENKIKEKFQWLQDCFHALDSNFLDAATNILTSKALVTEAMQNFQSYIKEDATCENAHQLVQLLQPHYSCLNINLLTIPCTITEPIKEQVEEYNTNLKMFRDTTSLLELAMMTRGMQCPDGVGCSKLILKLNKPWCSRTITDLKKMEKFYLSPISSFLTIHEVHRNASCSLTWTYLLPQLQTEIIAEAVIEQRVSLYKIGVFEVMIDDIPIMMEDEDKSFTFEGALKETYYQTNENVKSFLFELNITLPSKNDSVALMIASRKGDFLTVQFLLSKNLNINIRSTNGLTALMFASANGHHKVVELLLSKDPNINNQDNDGLTALMLASVKGHLRVVVLLLSKDPNIINIQNNDGWTALMFASGSGHIQVVELLLSKDPDINIRDNGGRTALITASVSGHHQVVELLLRSKDLDINIQNNDGQSALMCASRIGHHQSVKLLLSKDPDINIQDNDGWTALMAASCNKHHQVVELLLSKDPNINIQNNEGVTALISASASGHHQVVKLLLSKDPDINIQNNNGVTALMIASTNGHHQVVQLLLSKDPDINIQHKYGGTALMLASGDGHHQVVGLLLNKNPDINIQNNDGLTALIASSTNGHHQVVELLLSKDPDINIQDNCGGTALMLASANGHHQVVELLLSKDLDINIRSNDGLTALMFASIIGHLRVVELLLSKNQDINIRNNDGLTALMFAIGKGHLQVAELLLSKDPDINIQDNDGGTALMLASVDGHHQVVELLLSKDPDINIQNYNGVTALMAASRYGHHQVVELLLSKDPDINIQNNDGLTALRIASVNGHHQVVELLLSKDPNIIIQDKDGATALFLILFLSNFIINNHFLVADDASLDMRTQLLDQLHSGDFLKILELLLENHPNHIHTIGGEKLHSLVVAAVSNNFDAVTILMKKCDITPENIISAFTQACYAGHSSMVIHLYETITTLSTNNRRLVAAAAEGDLGTLISMIYEVGMSPDTPLVAGITPLMIAASCGHIELVEALIQAGADVNKKNDEGMNALAIVSNIGFYDRSAIKELLITNTPAGEADPASNNDETTDPVLNTDEIANKKPSTITTIKSILGMFNSFMKKAYDPYYSKQKELKIPYGMVTNAPYSAMTSNVAQLVS